MNARTKKFDAVAESRKWKEAVAEEAGIPCQNLISPDLRECTQTGKKSPLGLLIHPEIGKASLEFTRTKNY